MVGVAAVLVTALGLRAFASVVAPVFLAVVLSVTVQPLRRLPARRGLPTWVGAVLSLLAVYAIVVGLIVASLLNLWFQSSAFSLVISAVGVLLFAGLTAYDTQRIKGMYDYVAGTDMMGKAVIMGALSLYLDFVNMFQFLLAFMGGSRD